MAELYPLKVQPFTSTVLYESTQKKVMSCLCPCQEYNYLSRRTVQKELSSASKLDVLINPLSANRKLQQTTF